MAVVVICCAILIAVDVALLALWARRYDRAARPGVGFKLLRLLMITGWAWWTIPGLLERLISGRADDIPLVGSTAPALAPIPALANWLLSSALIAVALVAAVHNLRARRGAPGGWALAVALLPWVTVGFLAVVHEAEMSPLVACYPLVALAFWAARPPVEVFKVLGWLTVVTAVLSLALGLFTDAGTLTEASFVDKFGWAALAGPFTHPNMLGSVLALGLPFVLLSFRGRRAQGLIAVGLVLWATAWSSSRSGMAATVGVILAMLIVPALARQPAARKAAVWMTVAALLSIMWWLPWHTVRPSDFNYRGRVWLGSRHLWEEHRWFGGGPDAYLAPGQYRTWLGDYAYHGHNMLVDALAIGGVALAAALFVLIAALTSRAAQAFASGEVFAYGAVVAFVAEGVLEVSTNFWLPSSTSLLAWLLVVGALFCRPTAPRVELPGHLDQISRERITMQR